MHHELPPSQPPIGLSAAAAVAAWVALLATLSLTVQPAVAAAAFAGLCLLARELRMSRLITISLLVGAGMLLVVPGLSVVDGSWSMTFGQDSQWLPEPTAMGIAAALASSLRVPAQVLSVVLLAAVPASQAMLTLARWSPRSALLAAIAARSRILLEQDARSMRDELRSRGVSFDGAAPLASRLAAFRLLASSLVAGAIDRAFDTAAALHTRGHGASRPTDGALTAQVLVTGGMRSRSLDVSVASLAVAAFIVVVAGRTSGQLAAPRIQVLSGVDQPLTPAALLLSLLVVLIGAVPARALARARREAASSTSVAPPSSSSAPVRQAMGNEHAEDTGLGARACSRVGHDPVLVIRGLAIAHPRQPRPTLIVPPLEVARGELVLITGQSGSGKSTLLDAITGVGPAVASICVDGSIGVVGSVGVLSQDPQRQAVIDVVAEDVALSLRNDGLPLAGIEQQVIEALSALGCLHLARRRCSTLSGGELQKVMLAAALARRPQLLVLDEPTAQLDDSSAGELWTVIDRERRSRGLTVLVAEHRVDDLRARCDRELRCERGQVIEIPVGTVHRRPSTGPDRARDETRQAAFVDASSALQPHLPPVLAAHGLGVLAPDGRRVVDGLDLAMAPGTVLVVVGANGSGKSTLLRALRGLHPAAGVVEVCGQPLASVEAAAWHVSYVGQHAGSLVLAPTVIDHAMLMNSCTHDAAAAALVDAGLGHVAAMHPSELSIGQRQRLAIVSATLRRTATWLLDEPTRGMDDTACEWLHAMIARHRRSGGVCVIATHDERLVHRQANLLLELGRSVRPHVGRVDRPAGVVLLPDRQQAGEVVVQ